MPKNQFFDLEYCDRLETPPESTHRTLNIQCRTNNFGIKRTVHKMVENQAKSRAETPVGSINKFTGKEPFLLKKILKIQISLTLLSVV